MQFPGIRLGNPIILSSLPIYVTKTQSLSIAHSKALRFCKDPTAHIFLIFHFYDVYGLQKTKDWQDFSTANFVSTGHEKFVKNLNPSGQALLNFEGFRIVYKSFMKLDGVFVHYMQLLHLKYETPWFFDPAQ